MVTAKEIGKETVTKTKTSECDEAMRAVSEDVKEYDNQMESEGVVH